jgi:hypothetical protein
MDSGSMFLLFFHKKSPSSDEGLFQSMFQKRLILFFGHSASFVFIQINLSHSD